MNPSMCRQAFVDERASSSAAAGPSNQGAAIVMGHSEQQWRNWYDMQFQPRLAKNAVNSMKLWRTAMLKIRSDALVAAAELSLSTAHVAGMSACQIVTSRSGLRLACMVGTCLSLSSLRHK